MSKPVHRQRVCTDKEIRKLFRRARKIDPSFAVQQKSSGHWQACNENGKISGSVTPSDRYAAANVKRDMLKYLGIDIQHDRLVAMSDG